MKIAVVGSRTYKHTDRIRYNLQRAIESRNCSIYDVEIISGGAYGPDTIGIEYAKQCGLKTKIYLPDWKKFGKAAGPIRNELIVKDADMILAFWDGSSRGTKSTIDYAVKYEKTIFVVSDEDEPVNLFPVDRRDLNSSTSTS